VACLGTAKDGGTGAGFASSVTHAPGGPVTGLKFGNGLTLSQTFNLRQEPLSVASGPERLSYIPSPNPPRPAAPGIPHRAWSSRGWAGGTLPGRGRRSVCRPVVGSRRGRPRS